MQLPYSLYILSSSIGVVEPQCDSSSTLRKALYKFSSLEKIHMMEEYIEPSPCRCWILMILFYILQ